MAAGASLLVTAVAVGVWMSRPPQADLRPIAGQNVLLITIDTLRADALGAYGGPAATPALDRLAGEGVRFDFAHAHAVMTLPSHASILTGELPFVHGLRDNAGYRLPAGARTTATMLKQAGYATAAFVGAFPLHSRFGLNAGFDVYDDRVGDESGPTDFVMPERPAPEVVSLARRWMADAAARPWFVWVHVFDPHAPYRPPAPYDTQYAGRPYHGEVAATDAALAPLLDDVRTSSRPTLVIVTSDHGEGLGDHGEDAHGLFAYESTLRVPLIVTALGGGTARPRVAEVSSVSARHIDIVPTILDAVGRPVPPDLPGRTLLPRAERRAGSAPRPTYFEAMSGTLNHGWAPLSGALVARDKWIDLPIAERYDLAADPGELTNLSGRRPERDRELAAALSAFAPSLPGRERRVAEDPEAAARLRALGYVSGTAPAKARYGEDDDPKRLVELDRAMHQALDLAGSGREAEAAAIYRGIITRRPGMAIAYRHLALLAWQQADAAGAVGVLRQAVANGVTDARVIGQLGGYLSDTGQLEEGIRLLEPLAHDTAADADTLNALAIAYARARRPGDARAMFERLLEVMPGSSAPLENLGVLALEVGDAVAATQYFARAIAVAPGSSRAHAGAGAAAFGRGDKAAAYEAWARAVELDPSNHEAALNLGVNLARDGRVGEARPYLLRILQATPPVLPPAQRREVERLLGGERR